ncbi:MAG TPA: hypothetical protein VFK35_00120 [Candidatus Limnocylindrales bacterium]|nr:hypothetical protein [Candidatus Limnocylindrales bacterium]
MEIETRGDSLAGPLTAVRNHGDDDAAAAVRVLERERYSRMNERM